MTTLKGGFVSMAKSDCACIRDCNVSMVPKMKLAKIFNNGVLTPEFFRFVNKCGKSQCLQGKNDFSYVPTKKHQRKKVVHIFGLVFSSEEIVSAPKPGDQWRDGKAEDNRRAGFFSVPSRSKRRKRRA